MKMKKKFIQGESLADSKQRQQMQSMPVPFKLAWCYYGRGQGVRHFTLNTVIVGRTRDPWLQ